MVKLKEVHRHPEEHQNRVLLDQEKFHRIIQLTSCHAVLQNGGK